MTIKYAILGLLARHPQYGYELRANFKALVGGDEIWDVKPAQIYSTLARLEQVGYIYKQNIMKEAGPEKIIYALTPIGSQELEKWFKIEVNNIPARDEFFIKLLLSLESEITISTQVIKTQRSKLRQELHKQTTRVKEADPEHELANILHLNINILHIEADLRWLDMVEARIEDLRKQSLPRCVIRPRGRPKKSI
jgi:DNA-binding PadR family transcriptional regulator